MMKPVMTPNISRLPELLNLFDTASIAAAVRTAPAIAASAMLIPPVAAVVFPPVIVAIAAPRAAPELMPMMCGSARELRRILCI